MVSPESSWFIAGTGEVQQLLVAYMDFAIDISLINVIVCRCSERKRLNSHEFMLPCALVNPALRTLLGSYYSLAICG